MKKRLCLLPLVFCTMQVFADPIDPANDKSVCQINDRSVELSTIGIPSNTDYRKEAELLPGLTAKFAYRYIHYGRRTYFYRIVLNNQVFAMSETTTVGDDPIISTEYSTLSLRANVQIDEKMYNVKCEFIVNGNKEEAEK